VLDGGRDLNEKMEGNWEIERRFFPCVFFVRDRVFVVLFDEFSLAFFFFLMSYHVCNKCVFSIIIYF
jgi:hypothetical protein